MKQNNTSQKKPTIWEVIMSVLAAMFGVQSTKSRERDFTHGNPLVFITVGIIIAIFFVLLLYGIVHLVISVK